MTGYLIGTFIAFHAMCIVWNVFCMAERHEQKRNQQYSLRYLKGASQ